MISFNKNGLTDEQVKQSQEKYGTNILSKKEPKSVFSMFLSALSDIWIKVLIGALFIKIILTIIGIFFPSFYQADTFIEIISILIAIVLATGFTTYSEYKNTSRSEALQEEYSRTYAKVIRNGKILSILTSDIVKGDLILIQAGDKVPVDGLLIDGNIKVSQAALNGESRDENKTYTTDDKEAESTDYKSEHKVFMGSVVTSGEGYIVATVIGDNSELGKINKSLTETGEERKSTSALKLEVSAENIGKAGISVASISAGLQIILAIISATYGTLNNVSFLAILISTIIFVTMIVLMSYTKINRKFATSIMICTILCMIFGISTSNNHLTSLLLLISDSIMLMASIVIMAVPEGLPMMNSMVQAMNTEALYKKHILVRRNAAFADSSYINILFSDKTGTITKGNLSLVEFLLGNGIVVDKVLKDDFIDSITLNNASKVSAEGKALGSNNMDRALLSYALSNGYDEISKSIDKVKKGSVSSFDSEKKCATIDLIDGSQYWKGATELIIDDVTHYIDINGNIVEFKNTDKEKLQEKIIEQAKRTMKLLSIVKTEKDKVILYSVACFRDDVRADAIETVKVLNKAGIQVVMVTGDAEETAVAIAKEAGILQDEYNDIVLTHEELEAMSDDELKEKITHLKVVSRAKPLDKKRLVTIAQSLDNVVGMTGDGVNDAPALQQADTGFAMGDGTAVAQEAGDIVIMDNSLTSIKDCILNSRTMSKSVGKFLIFQLTVNVSTMLMNIIAPILGWGAPFSIVEILWINLIMDTLAALAFGCEPILERYMNEKPVKRKADILTKYIKASIGIGAVFITIGSIIILENIGGILDFVTPSNHPDISTYERTFMFAFFIFSIIFNSLNTRSEGLNLFEKIGSNKKFIIVMSGIFLMQTLLLEFGGAVFGTVPLTLTAYLVAMGLAILIIPVNMVGKIILKLFIKDEIK